MIKALARGVIAALLVALCLAASATAQIRYTGPTFSSTGEDTLTWGDGTLASFVWTFDVSGTDTTFTFGNDDIAIGTSLSLGGKTAEAGFDVVMEGNLLLDDGGIYIENTSGTNLLLAQVDGSGRIELFAAGTNSMMRVPDAVGAGNGLIRQGGSSTSANNILHIDRQVVASAAGATLTCSSCIPANSIVWGVHTDLTTAFGVTNGLTSFDIGISSDLNAWGATLPITLDDKSDISDWTATAPFFIGAATDITLTGNGDGGDEFDGTGSIRLIIFYNELQAII